MNEIADAFRWFACGFLACALIVVWVLMRKAEQMCEQALENLSEAKRIREEASK